MKNPNAALHRALDLLRDRRQLLAMAAALGIRQRRDDR